MSNPYNSPEAKQLRVETALRKYNSDPSDTCAGYDIIRHAQQGELKTIDGKCINLYEKNVLFKVLRLAKDFKLRYNPVDS
jgi:hypothetical protein